MLYHAMSKLVTYDVHCSHIVIMCAISPTKEHTSLSPEGIAAAISKIDIGRYWTTLVIIGLPAMSEGIVIQC